MNWDQEVLEVVVQLARRFKWDEIDRQPGITMISFQKDIGSRGGVVRMNVYLTTKSTQDRLKLTVSTSMNHPKKGKTQLFRRNVTRTQLVHLMKNPRKHTTKGYYQRP